MIQPDPKLPWPIDYADGVLPIAADESCKLKAYKCIAGKWTCGFGETEGVGPNTVWTQDYADQRFCDSLTERAQAVKAACSVEPTAHQLSALVSLAYNIGMEALAKSTVLRAHNRGDHLAASRAFSLFDKFRNPATGKLEVSHGLAARRAREAALYLKPAENGYPMPQAVAPQSAVAASPIAQGGAATVGAGVLATLGAAGDQLGTVSTTVKSAKDFATDTLGIPADWFLPGLLVAVGAYVLWHRAQQRLQGWA